MTAARPPFRPLSRLAPGSLVALLAACATAPPPAPAPLPALPEAPAPPPDLSPVPTPANLVFSGRVANPAASFKVATDWARLPSMDPTTLVEGVITAMTHRRGDAKLASVVDVAQPIDFASSFEVSLPPRPLVALAAAVASIDAAKSALAASYDLRPGNNGVLLLSPREDEAASRGEDAPACELAPSAGAAPFRLVCGSSAASLRALGPYLTRTTPQKPSASDIHLEARAQPLAGFAQIARMQGPRLVQSLIHLDPATEAARIDLVSAVIGDALDLVGDLGTITVDATLDPAHAVFVARTGFRSTTSLLARLATEHLDAADVPPSSFWRVPADVDFASFGSGIDEADLQHPRDLLAAAFEEAFEGAKLLSSDRDAVVKVIRESIRGTRGLAAHGTAAAASYWLLEWDEPAPVIEKVARDMAAARARPAVVKWAAADTTPSHMKAGFPSLTIAQPLAWLPKGSLHAVLTVPPPASPPTLAPPPVMTPVKGAHLVKGAKPPTPAPDAYQVAIIPDGPRTWVALSTSEAALRASLASVPGATSTASLGAHATALGLDTFKESRMTAGGLFTLRAFAAVARDGMAAREGVPPAAWDAVVDHLPARGLTPITVTATPLPPTVDDRGGAREMRMIVPAEAIRDMVWFGMQADQLKRH